MIQWIGANETVLWWLAAASIVTFLASLIAVPVAIVRIPSDYFSQERRYRTPWADQHPVVRAILLVGKNFIGYLFVGAGITMLVLPGQGILTILIGIMLMDFPGKYRCERWLVARRPVRRSMNWLRRRAKRAPLVLERF